jgi:AcrR family transcriptional regulator
MQVSKAGTPKAAYHHGDLRKALLAAAELELAEKGVEGFTLRGCAMRAGVSHAAPAHHFKDANALLTELAAEGFARFSASMRRRQAASDANPRAQLVGAGLGYIDFARSNPALFRLMFSSFRTDFEQPALHQAASVAFSMLVDSVAAFEGRDPLGDQPGRQHVAAAWAMAHGLADLLLSDRMPFVGSLNGQELDDFLAGILTRSIPERA